jgi:hypothetical protein
MTLKNVVEQKKLPELFINYHFIVVAVLKLWHWAVLQHMPDPYLLR